jgi:uncharacterized protein (TIGR03437 family)
MRCFPLLLMLNFVASSQTLSSVIPNSATAGGSAFTLTVNGAGFVSGGAGSAYPPTVVLWNGSPLSTSFISQYQLTAFVPAILIAAPASVTITFVNVFGSTSNALTFTIIPAPSSVTLSSLNPNSAHVGDPFFTMTVNGSGFLAGATVLWNGSPLSTKFISSNQLNAFVGSGLLASSGIADIRVANPVGAASNALTFTIYAVPTSISASPSSLTFTFKAGGSAPAAQTLVISTDSPNALTAFVAPLATVGVAASPTSGNTPATLTVSVNPATLDLSSSNIPFPLEPGFYEVFILVEVAGQVALSIPVFLNILDASGAEAYPIVGSWQLTAGQGPAGQIVGEPLFTATVQIMATGTPSLMEIPPPLNQGGFPSLEMVVSISGQFTFTFSPGSLSPTGNPCVTTTQFDGAFTLLATVFSSTTDLPYVEYPNIVSLDLVENGRDMNFTGGLLGDDNSPFGSTLTGTYATVSGGYGCSDGELYPQGNWFAKRSLSPTISSTPNSLSFAYQSGGAPPPAQTLSLSGSSPVAFSVTIAGGNWLSVTPSQGTTPATLVVSVNPTGLGAGTSKGSITLSASGATDSPQTIPVTFTVTADQVTVTSVVSAASLATGPIAPGEIVTIRGAGLGPTTGVLDSIDPNSGRVGTKLAGTQVFFDGVAAPILYTGENQVNAAGPCSVAGRPSTQMVVQYLGAQSAPFAVPLNAAGPGIFTVNSSGNGQGAVLNQDNSLNGPANPAPHGSAIAIYATGVPTSPCVDGQIYQSNFPQATSPVVVGVGNIGAHVLYAGQAPGLISGVAQINIVIPNDAPTGVVPLTLLVGGVFSPPGVTIAVK